MASPSSNEAAARPSNAVRVLVRVRPLLPRELALPVCVGVQQDGDIEVQKGTQCFRSRYETVLPEHATQEAVYGCLREAVSDAFAGYNATVLAYGQTGTGKTFTMMGSHEIHSSDELQHVGTAHGLIPRAICDMFARSLADGRHSSVTIICSYMEIYNDHLYDLLQPFKKHVGGRSVLDMKQLRAGLSVKEDRLGQTCVQHLMAVKVTDLEQVFQLIKQGNEQRSMRQTELNQHSSRGHSILQFLIEQRHPLGGSNTVTRSKINFVDLAGSERYPADNSSRARVTEMNAINVSLSALASVVSALVSRDKHVPYRDSKLTHLLKDSLGGNCNTYVIATVSPSAGNFEETVSTLKFADRASAITNNAVKNVQLDLNHLLEMKDREINRLRAMVAAFAEQRGGGDLSRGASRATTAESQLQTLRSQIEQLQDALDLERRRAAELEGQMRGVTVVDAPDLLDVDALRRGASLESTACTSAPRPFVLERLNGGRRSSSGRAAVADDLSICALEPRPHSTSPYESPGRFAAPQAGGDQRAASREKKRRPPGRTRSKVDGPQESTPLGTPLGSLLARPFLATAQDTPNTQSRNYQSLLDMYSKLASDVDDLRRGVKPLNSRSASPPKRRKPPARAGASRMSSTLPLSEAARQQNAPQGADRNPGWGLRNILVSDASPERASPLGQQSPVTPGGFGLRSILKSPSAASLGATQPLSQAARQPAASALNNPDVFDTGSWIYILGPSASSFKSKQIARSTRSDPRLARVALKSDLG